MRKSLHFHQSILKANLKFSSRAAWGRRSRFWVLYEFTCITFGRILQSQKPIASHLREKANFPAALLDENSERCMFQATILWIIRTKQINWNSYDTQKSTRLNFLLKFFIHFRRFSDFQFIIPIISTGFPWFQTSFILIETQTAGTGLVFQWTCPDPFWTLWISEISWNNRRDSGSEMSLQRI